MKQVCSLGASHGRVRLIYLLLSVGASVLGQTSQPPLQPGQVEPGQIQANKSQTGKLNTIAAPPLTVREKFQIRVIDEFGARGLIGNALGAGIGQLENTPGEWGQGMQGYSLRYVSGLGHTLSRQTMAWGIETATHSDPRYFPSSEPGFKARFGCAMKQVFWVKRDNGSDGFAYGRVVSAFAAGQLANAWQPASNNGVGNGIERAFITIGGDAAFNMAQEVFPFLRPKSLRNVHR